MFMKCLNTQLIALDSSAKISKYRYRLFFHFSTFTQFIFLLFSFRWIRFGAMFSSLFSFINYLWNCTKSTFYTFDAHRQNTLNNWNKLRLISSHISNSFYTFLYIYIGYGIYLKRKSLWCSFDWFYLITSEQKMTTTKLLDFQQQKK